MKITIPIWWKFEDWFLFTWIALCNVLIVFAACSCGTYTKVAANGEVTIQQGLLSSIQQSAVSVTPNGVGKMATVTAIQTGYDGTSVVNNGIAVIVPVAIAKYAFKTVDSNNALTAKQGHQAVQNNAITHPVTSTTSAVGPNGGTLNTSTTVVPPLPK